MLVSERNDIRIIKTHLSRLAIVVLFTVPDEHRKGRKRNEKIDNFLILEKQHKKQDKICFGRAQIEKKELN